MNPKIKVAVLGGGISNERDISLSTAKQVLDNLNKEKFVPLFYDTKTDLKNFFNDAYNKNIDVCFIALHGRGGEDGSIQGMLELLDIPYIGSGILSSAIGMNKILSKRIFEAHKIKTPAILRLKSNVFPCIVKPSNGGSSVGISIARNAKELWDAIGIALKQDNQVLIEEYIEGVEITVGILGNKNLQALPVVEIRPKNKFFDFQAKYDSNFCEEIVPAEISEQTAREAQELAKKVYKILGCKGFGRIDMILKNRVEPYVLEINTIPGLTPNSLLPKAASAAGIAFPTLLEKIINFALEKND